jgi:hypothetical protein
VASADGFGQHPENRPGVARTIGVVTGRKRTAVRHCTGPGIPEWQRRVWTGAKHSRAALLIARSQDRCSGVPQGENVAAVSVDGQHLLDQFVARRGGLRGFVEVDDVLLAAGDELVEVVVGRTGGFVAGDDDSWFEGRDLVNAGYPVEPGLVVGLGQPQWMRL